MNIPEFAPNDDFVNFKVDNGPVINYKCYKQHMDLYVKSDFELLPASTIQISSGDYYKWMSLARKNNLLPKNSDIGSNTLFIRKGSNKHQFYAALCCHRWAQNQPIIPYVVLKLLETKNIHFFQALHSALLEGCKNINHSFLSISVSSVYNPNGNNLKLSASACYFFKGAHEQKCEPTFKSTEQNTSFKIKDFAKEVKNFQVEDVTDEKYKIIYEQPSIPMDFEACLK